MPHVSQVPGQYVGVRLEAVDAAVGSPAGGAVLTADKLLAIASSPYDARRESSMLDASIIEVSIERDKARGRLATANDVGWVQIGSKTQLWIRASRAEANQL